jgi:hypothetical protein
MIITTADVVTIFCDKCKTQCSANEDLSNKIFFMQGWGLFPNARKYHHLCAACQTRKARKAHSFVIRNFPIS